MPNQNSNKPPNSPPSQAEFGLLNAYLAQQGLTPQQRKAAVGETIHGRTRLEISEQARGYFKNQ